MASNIAEDITLLKTILFRIVERHPVLDQFYGSLIISLVKALTEKVTLIGDEKPGFSDFQAFLDENLSTIPSIYHMELVRKVVGCFRLTLELIAMVEDYHVKHRSHLNTDSLLLNITSQSNIDFSSIPRIRLVSTAHPTQVYRETYLHHEQEVLKALNEWHLANDDITRVNTINKLEGIVETLWMTRFERWESPSVFEEAKGITPYLETILEVLPMLSIKLKETSSAHDLFPIKIASWIGGDMDGNPHTTAETLSMILDERRLYLLNYYETEIANLAKRSSFTPASGFYMSDEFEKKLNDMYTSYQQQVILDDNPYHNWIHRFHNREPLRQWLLLIASKLYFSKTLNLKAEDSSLTSIWAYLAPTLLGEDIAHVVQLLQKNNVNHTTIKPFERLAEVVNKFGFHWVGIDIRQEALLFQKAVNDWVGANAPGVNDDDREQWLIEQLDSNDIPVCQITAEQFESDRLVGMLKYAGNVRKYVSGDIGNYLLLSMTHSHTDILAALLLARWCGLERKDSVLKPVNIVPLFETVEDLKKCNAIMEALYQLPQYRIHCQSTQTILMAYSDSNKDGGYLTSQWLLYSAQENLIKIAVKYKIDLQFYHGRGSSIGRGGGPTKQFIDGLPKNSLVHGLQITEQGEVLTHHYLSAANTIYHWEQYLVSLSKKKSIAEEEPLSPWLDAMSFLSREAFKSYGSLKKNEGFVEFFESATPREIHDINIGSRPSHRRKVKTLQDLRAIPWVFRWYQARFMLPGWYGVGSAIEAFYNQSSSNKQLLVKMYTTWPYFKALIDNCYITLLQSHGGLMEEYSALHETPEPIMDLIKTEHSKTKELVKSIQKIVGDKELPTSAIRQSFKLKKSYLDPLNYLQLYLLKKYRSEEFSDENKTTVQRALVSSVAGVIAGLGVAG